MNVMFKPQKDITAYELAIIYQHIAQGNTALKYAKVFCDKDQWSEIVELGIQRHFEIIEE